MEGLQHVVLEQRVQPWPIGGRVGNLDERVGRAEHEAKEENSDSEHGEQRPTDHRVVQTVTEAPHHDAQVAGEDERPQQDRAFERAPQRGDGEQNWGADAAVLSNVLHAEVVAEQRGLHHHETDDRGQNDDPDVASNAFHCSLFLGRERIAVRDQAQDRRSETYGDRGVANQYVHDLVLPDSNSVRRIGKVLTT